MMYVLSADVDITVGREVTLELDLEKHLAANTSHSNDINILTWLSWIVMMISTMHEDTAKI